MKKTYGIRFVSQRTDYMSDDNTDIEEAIEMASCNLRYRHHVRLLDHHIQHKILWITLDVPEKLLPFDVGKRLSGIARYLLRTYPEKYRPLMSGNRLFYYYLDED